jgi:hypothetical protein
MNKRDLIVFLVLQLIAIVVAGASFKIFESRVVAGAVAGSYFVASGLYMVRRVWRWFDRWQALMTYPLLVHVFVISIPLLVIRMSNTGVEFSDLKIFGVPGPVFHQISTTIFMIMMIATVVDLVRVLMRKRVNRVA